MILLSFILNFIVMCKENFKTVSIECSCYVRRAVYISLTSLDFSVNYIILVGHVPLVVSKEDFRRLYKTIPCYYRRDVYDLR